MSESKPRQTSSILASWEPVTLPLGLNRPPPTPDTMPWDTQDSMYFSAQAALGVLRTSENVGVAGVPRVGSSPPFRATQIILVISERLMFPSGL